MTVQQTKMRRLRSRFIVGTQYSRPPTPLPEDWEDDFKRMQDVGVEAIKFWIYWRWVESKRGVFDFGDYDRLFETAAKYELQMHPNLFVESAPEWIFREYPDCLHVSAERKVMHPSCRPGATIDGESPCFDHDAVRAHGIHFIHQAVERYKDHPNLLCWDIWNEVGLHVWGVMCACPASTARYHRWLEARYGDIETLNDQWRMRHGEFADVYIGTNANHFAPFINCPWPLWRQDKSRARTNHDVVTRGYGACDPFRRCRPHALYAA